jgi:outer membrane protein
MKRSVYISLSTCILGCFGFILSCQEKAKVQEKAPATTQAPPTTAEVAPVTSTSNAPDSARTTEKAPATSTSQNQKFGYINSADLIKLMPETKRAEANLNAFIKTLENKFGSMQSDYQKKITEFQAQEKTMIDAVKQTRIKDITDLEQQMQQTQMASQQQVAAKRETLFKPILDKAEKAIKDVGKENNYDYIFDTNTGSFVYAKESHNVLPLVKAKLGIK